MQLDDLMQRLNICHCESLSNILGTIQCNCLYAKMRDDNYLIQTSSSSSTSTLQALYKLPVSVPAFSLASQDFFFPTVYTGQLPREVCYSAVYSCGLLNFFCFVLLYLSDLFLFPFLFLSFQNSQDFIYIVCIWLSYRLNKNP